MSDTRKDKRAPISLKVRFKSATVDEFIEQYSLDISKGGIFIKSKTPMSIGTLLKFEFRLKDESRLIHGVGRVVWKRDDGDSAGKAPGMGIKFIKMDPESRVLVESMVGKRGDSPGRYEEGQVEEEKVPAAPAAKPFFPSTSSPMDLPPPEDRTQVRHASEFLASALAEGEAESASKEAEKKAAEARQRTEEIERKRAAAADAAKKKPRLKKTLVGVGVPDEMPPEEPALFSPDADDDVIESRPAPKIESKPPRIEARPAARSDVSDSAETKAMDRRDLEEEVPAFSDVEIPDEPTPMPVRPPDAVRPAARMQDDVREDSIPPPRALALSQEDGGGRPSAPRQPAAPPPPEKSSSGARWGILFFAVMVLAGLAVVGYIKFGPGNQGAQNDTREPIAAQPDPDPSLDTTEEPTPPEDDTEEPTDLAVQQDEEPTPPEPPPPSVPTMAVQVSATTPPNAVISVDGAERGPAPIELQLPIGQAVTVSARLPGYREASQQITAQEGQRPLRFTLEQMLYVIHVATEPPGARVRGGPGAVVAPADMTLRRPPTAPIPLTATLAGHDNANITVEPAAFTEQAGRMVASVTIALQVRTEPAPPQPRNQETRPRQPREPREQPVVQPPQPLPPENPPANPPPENNNPPPQPPANPPAEEAPPDNPFG
jgi:uncharacterized protein (TIGR02266 family)